MSEAYFLLNYERNRQRLTEVFFILSGTFSVIQNECGALTLSGNSGWGMYLKLVTLSTDTAG